MTDTYTTQHQQYDDNEVFRLVKRNPTRKVDADLLPPIAMGKDGKLFFMDPTPALSDIIRTIGGIALLILGVFIGIVGITYILATGSTNVNVLLYCVIGVISTFAIISLKGEKKNVQH